MIPTAEQRSHQARRTAFPKGKKNGRRKQEGCTMTGRTAGTYDTIEYFGRYIHNVHFRTLADIERHLPAIREMLGEGFEDLPPTYDEGNSRYTVEVVSNDLLDETQIAALQHALGVLSCDCNEDMQESGVGCPVREQGA